MFELFVSIFVLFPRIERFNLNLTLVGPNPKELRRTGSINASDKDFEPLFETSAIAPVKVKGFLRLERGDIVAVLDVDRRGSQATVRCGDEIGKVPLQALLIDQHCYNAYLQANINVLSQSPSLLHFACAVDSSMVECVVDTLATRSGALLRALTTLIAIEVTNHHPLFVLYLDRTRLHPSLG